MTSAGDPFARAIAGTCRESEPVCVLLGVGKGLTSVQWEPTTGADDASVREWVAAAVGRIEADRNRSAETHLIALPLPGYPDGYTACLRSTGHSQFIYEDLPVPNRVSGIHVPACYDCETTRQRNCREGLASSG